MLKLNDKELIETLENAEKILNRKDYYYLLDEKNEVYKCTLREWGEWFQNSRNDNSRRVGEDFIDNKTISTVFLGIDHNLYDDGEPLLFETMVFNERGNEIYCNRYFTWQEAEIGHKKAIKWVEEGCRDED